MNNQSHYTWFESSLVALGGFTIGQIIAVTESVANLFALSSLSVVLTTVESSIRMQDTIQNAFNTGVGVVIAFTVTKICQWAHSKITKAFNKHEDK